MEQSTAFDALIEDFRFNLRRGGDVQAVVAALRDAYHPVLETPDARFVFVTRLAEAAWTEGCLYPALRDDALGLIRSALEQRPDPALAALAETLQAPQPDAALAKTWRGRVASLFGGS